MKKFIAFIALICAFACCVSPVTTFAADEVETDFVAEETATIEEFYIESSSLARTSGLIDDYDFTLYKIGTSLKMVGYTYGTSEVVKCGFKSVKVQYRASSSDSWSTYTSYSSLYNDSNSYNFSKTITVTSGYQYRVTAVHYAKKSLLSTEKITSTTGYLSY